MVRFGFTASDGTKVVFREPNGDDAKLLIDFINPIMKEPMSGIMMTGRFGLKYEKRWLSERLKDIRKRELVMLIADVDGAVQGNCQISRMAGKQSHVGVLGIAVSKGLRGKGVGKEIMRLCISLARKRIKGLEVVQLATFSYNKRAQTLYKEMGFKKVACVPGTVKEGNLYFDEFFMILDLKKRR